MQTQHKYHPDTPEPQLLRASAAGDANAFELLYLRYRNEAFSFAITFLKSPEWAEDLLQDLFLKLWIRKENLMQIEAFRQYLFVSLRNMALNALTKSDAYERVKMIHKVEQLAKPATPDQEMEAGAVKQLIAQALLTLPAHQQEIYRLSREAGLNHEQIALKMNISHRTVSNTITRVLAHLRRFLYEHGYQVIWIAVLMHIL